MSAYSLPIVLRQGTPCRLLERIQLSPSSGDQIAEKTFQESLFANPQSLPVADIDASYGTLIPLCTELHTDSGRIDILYATSSGRLVLVETKLWRNPQARREVVAQILDYAAQLTRWSFEDLDARVSLVRKEAPGSVMRLVQQACPEIDEARYVDALSLGLRRGDFLLIIAGDGIRQDAESLVTLLERVGHARFKLSLVEMAAYRLSADEILLQPRVLARTEILERSILLMNGEPVELAEPSSSDPCVDPSGLDAQRARYRSFWSAFLKEMTLLDASFRVLAPTISTNQFFAMPPTASSCWVSAFVSSTRGVAGVYFATSRSFALADELFDVLSGQLDSIAKEIGRPLTLQTSGAGGSGRRLAWESLEFHDGLLEKPDAGWLKTLAEVTFRMVQALTPRINAVLRDADAR